MFRTPRHPLAALGLLMSLASPALAETGKAAADSSLPLSTSPDQGLTLEQAMDQAESHSFALKIADKTAVEAEERAAQTRSQLGPKVAVEGTDGWIDKKVMKLAGDQILTEYFPPRVENASVTATQPLLGLAPILTKLKADALAAEAARRDQDQTQANARLAGADVYIRALKARRLYEIAQASLAAVSKQRDDAAKLMRNGKLSRIDVVRLEYAVSDSQTQLIQARATMDVAALGLIETLGLPRESPSIILRASPKSEVEQRKLATPDLKMELTHAEGRPDMQSAAKRIEAAESYKSAAAWDYLPDVKGFATYTHDWEAISLDAPPIPGLLPNGLHIAASDYSSNFVVGANLSWVLWDWGSRNRRQGELAATVAKAKESREALDSQVHLEVAQAHAELSYSEQALASAGEALRLAEEVYRATDLKFKNGLATTTDLIDAERDLTRARATLANAQGDVDLAWLKLKRASGERVTI